LGSLRSQALSSALLLWSWDQPSDGLIFWQAFEVSEQGSYLDQNSSTPRTLRSEDLRLHRRIKIVRLLWLNQLVQGATVQAADGIDYPARGQASVPRCQVWGDFRSMLPHRGISAEKTVVV
jgi:hypothetical protein